MTIDHDYNDKNLIIDLSEMLNTSIDLVYKNDLSLITRKVHERSIVFRIGLYFNDLLRNSKYAAYDLDFDYNRNYGAQKTTENFPNGIYPDLILHKRGSNDSNLLAVEFMTSWYGNTDTDKKKLQDLTSLDQRYKYKLGISIVLENPENPSLCPVNHITYC